MNCQNAVARIQAKRQVMRISNYMIHFGLLSPGLLNIGESRPKAAAEMRAYARQTVNVLGKMAPDLEEQTLNAVLTGERPSFEVHNLDPALP